MYALSQSPCFPSYIMIRDELPFVLLLYSLSTVHSDPTSFQYSVSTDPVDGIGHGVYPPFFVLVFFPFYFDESLAIFYLRHIASLLCFCELCGVVPDAQNGGLI